MHNEARTADDLSARLVTRGSNGHTGGSKSGASWPMTRGGKPGRDLQESHADDTPELYAHHHRDHSRPQYGRWRGANEFC
jgi:hypothetical protein